MWGLKIEGRHTLGGGPCGNLVFDRFKGKRRGWRQDRFVMRKICVLEEQKMRMMCFENIQRGDFAC